MTDRLPKTLYINISGDVYNYPIDKNESITGPSDIIVSILTNIRESESIPSIHDLIWLDLRGITWE